MNNKQKTVDELMKFLSDGIKKMRYLSKERQAENQQQKALERENLGL